MKAVVWHGVGKIALDEVPDPVRSDPADAIVRITGSAICGTDLHFLRGAMPGMRAGTILGHEAVGIVEEVSFAHTDLVPIPPGVSDEQALMVSDIFPTAWFDAQRPVGVRRPSRCRTNRPRASRVSGLRSLPRPMSRTTCGPWGTRRVRRCARRWSWSPRRETVTIGSTLRDCSAASPPTRPRS
jgi:hypothetical protein